MCQFHLEGKSQSLQGGIDTSNQQYDLQNKMFENQRQATTENAFFDLGQSVIGAGASLDKAAFFDPKPAVPYTGMGSLNYTGD